MASAKVKDLVTSNKVMVFSKSYCPYCKKAKDALGAHQWRPSVLTHAVDVPDLEGMGTY